MIHQGTGAQTWESFRKGVDILGVGVKSSDDVWDLNFRNTKADTQANNKARFNNILEWLKPAAKSYVSYGWLVEDFSNSWVTNHIVALNFFSRYFNEYHQECKQLASLKQGMVDGFLSYLTQETSAEQVYNIASKIGDFTCWTRDQFGVPNNFFIDASQKRPPRKKGNKVSKLERLVPDEVIFPLIEAIRIRHNHIWDMWCKNPPSKKPVGTDFLYLQVLKLLITSPMRVSQVLRLSRFKAFRPSDGDEDPGIWIRFDESKTHQGEQEAYVPEFFAPIAVEAIFCSIEYTNALYQKHKKEVEKSRKKAERLKKEATIETGKKHVKVEVEEELDLIFLTDRAGGANGGGYIRGISAEAFRTWLNGRMKEDGTVDRAGFIHRHNIKYKGEYYQIDPHHCRHTLATKTYLGGAGYGTVSRYLKHREGSAGVAPMTMEYLHVVERQYNDIMNLQEAKGEGINSLVKGKLVQLNDLTEKDLLDFKERGMFVQLTAYGYCPLEEDSESCDLGDPAWIGPSNDPTYVQHNEESTIKSDIEILTKQQAIWEEDSTKKGSFKENVRGTLRRYDRALNFDPANPPKISVVPADAEAKSSELFKPPVKKPKPKRINQFFKKGQVNQKELVINGKTTSERVKETFQQAKRTGVRVTLKQFARMAKVSTLTLYQDYGVIVNEIREMSKLLSAEEVEVLSRLEQQYDLIKDTSDIVTVIDFIKLCGIDRAYMYNHFSDWAKKITDRNARVYARRELERVRERDERVEIQEKERYEVARLKLELAKQSDKGISLGGFAQMTGISPATLKKKYPELLEMLNDFNHKHAQAHKVGEKLAEVWSQIKSAGEMVSLIEVAKRCGVDRNYLYNNHGAWCNEFDEYKMQEDKRISLKCKEVYENMIASGEVFGLKDFATRVGIERKKLDRKFPEWGQLLRTMKRGAN